jgi:hypothetical protein
LDKGKIYLLRICSKSLFVGILLNIGYSNTSLAGLNFKIITRGGGVIKIQALSWKGLNLKSLSLALFNLIIIF